MRTTKTEDEIRILRDKILEGIRRSFKRLVIKTAKDDGELVFWRDGRVVYVKAKDLLDDVGEEK